MKKNILVVAYACEPDKGSEPGVGWNWAKQIAKKNKVIIITRNNNRASLEKALRADAFLNQQISCRYYDPSPKLTFWKQGSRGLQLYYLMWQVGVKKIVKQVIKENPVDYVFVPTFGNLWKPTFLYNLPCEFIWGPVGGGECVPKTLLRNLSGKQRTMEFLRRLSFKIPVANPWLYSICRGAKAILVRTDDSLNCIPKKYQDKCTVMIETGVDEQECQNYCANATQPSMSQDILVVGRLISLKYVDIAIKAFSKIQEQFPEARLQILGDGEERAKLEHLTRELGLEGKVCFHGNVPRDTVLEYLSHSRAVLMTSAKEGGAWVLFEAMMCKRPIVCMDTAGMHTVVQENGGIKILVSDYASLVDAFGNATAVLLRDGELANSLGENGYHYVSSDLLWSKKGELFEGLIQ
jgi:glycosyltransferase involved in cell wall biosynthesis